MAATSKTTATATKSRFWEYGIDFPLDCGINVPAIGLGTWRLEPDKVGQIVHDAIEMGYRHFDCASFYGNQKQIGDVLHQYFSNSDFGRHRFFITSKLWSTNHHRAHVKEELERTLHDLQCHHLDLFLMHFPFALQHGSAPVPKDESGKPLLDNVSLKETWQAMETAVIDGKCKSIGVANFRIDQLREILSFCTIKPSVLQIELHPYLQQQELIDFCHHNGILVMAYSPLGSDEGCQKLQNDNIVTELCKKYKKTPTQLVIGWNIQCGRAVIPRTHSKEHLKENLNVFDFTLSNEDINKLNGLNQGTRFISPLKSFGVPVFEDEIVLSQGGAGTAAR